MRDRNLNAKHIHKRESGQVAQRGVHHLLDGYTHMKHSAIIIIVLTIVSSIAFAAIWFNAPKEVPTISLPDAYRQAMTALGSATNTFHCTTAQWEKPGYWEFSFYNTNGDLKTVDANRVFDGRPPVY